MTESYYMTKAYSNAASKKHWEANKIKLNLSRLKQNREKLYGVDMVDRIYNHCDRDELKIKHLIQIAKAREILIQSNIQSLDEDSMFI